MVAVPIPSHQLRGPVKMKVCFVGDFAVGKTSVAERFVHNRFRSAYVPTIGTQILKKEFVVGNPAGKGSLQIDMVIWDIMGQKGFRELLNEAYFHGARGILAVCDITRGETLENLPYWIDCVLKVTGKIPIEIIGNKWDLRHQREMEDVDLSELGNRYDSGCHLTSAKTGRNVEEVFFRLAENHIIENVSASSHQPEDSSIRPTGPSHQRSSLEEAT
ncbi:MAG: Rab family GTPase [Thermoplasmata archaeon]